MANAKKSYTLLDLVYFLGVIRVYIKQASFKAGKAETMDIIYNC